ncbi:GroES-like protein [Saitoella complicata NRRL Y-17804]|nr:GroES-like protein [Saitoella complicata NRRL Y-17804]ODQ50930.1 GroES-like protein [Saitoella complicata NRRL Y-17804]
MTTFTPSRPNLALQTNPAHELNLITDPLPDLAPGHCLVHIRATGVCGSDVHFWKHGHIGPTMVVRAPNGLGHESAGVVVAVGEGVERWKVGDRVAVEPGVPCSKPECQACRTGMYNACPDVKFHSTPPYHGTLRRYHAHPAAWLHPLPDSLSFEDGALLEPLSVVLAAFARLPPMIGQPVLIAGAGPIGLISLLCAEAAGAWPLVVTDMDAGRLEWCKKLVSGVHTVQVQKTWTPEETAEHIVSANGGLRPVITLECTGAEPSIASAIYASAHAAKIHIIGVGPSTQRIPFMHLSTNEIDLQYQYRYRETWPRAIRVMESGRLEKIRNLVTHRFGLEEAKEAMELSADYSRGGIKVQIVDEEEPGTAAKAD